MTRERGSGFSLIELIVTVALISILVGLALPLARNTIQREREKELRQALRDIRAAIDRYKTAADNNQIMADAMANGYPPDLDPRQRRGFTLGRGQEDLLPARCPD